MPSSLVKFFAKKYNKSVDQAEKLWNKAKGLAADAGKSEDWAYITGIFKRLISESPYEPKGKDIPFVAYAKDELTTTGNIATYPAPFKRKKKMKYKDIMESVFLEEKKIAKDLIDQVVSGTPVEEATNPAGVIRCLPSKQAFHKSFNEKDRKKLISAVFKGFKKVGDAKKIGGNHKVIDAADGFKSYALDDMSDDELKALAKKKGIKI